MCHEWICNKKWWFKLYTGKNEEIGEVKVTFLHPSGPSLSFSYPIVYDILWIFSTDVISKVNHSTPTSSVYILSTEEIKKIA